jgi:uncharacterized repeat protein (TIGR01451 family)
MTRKTFKTVIAVLIALIVPAVFTASASAAAAVCSNPGVQVQAAPTVSTVGTPVTYNYSFCYNTNGADYTVQVLSETPSTTGSGYVANAASPLAMTALAAQPGTVSGSGVFTPTAAGRYEVEVAYYMQGQAAWEDEGQTVFIVNAAPVTVPPVVTVPTPPVTPQGVPSTPAVATPAPLAPVGATAPPAALSLTKTTASKVVAAGSAVKFTLTVGNTSSATADDVKVCDHLPAGTLYVSASRTAAFQGADACFKVGNLASGAKSVTTITLRLAKTASGTITNHATATAANAPTVKAQAPVKVRGHAVLTPAPVTG